ncbi:MAG: EscU/YscU/HrcU family type III secretion system export apparatus switch protein [Deltaproteobacteria bacterium]|nr:EscU/YscU/HrcU family type III secretion system export apparatus switch protein [Deltaproteobacteria bacterium]
MTEDSSDSSGRQVQKRAIALHYKDATELPKVLASGVDEIALRIIQLAEEHDVPVHQDKMLSELLAKVNQGAPISPESYRLVAEVISFLYHMNKEWREKHPNLSAVLESPVVGSLPEPPQSSVQLKANEPEAAASIPSEPPKP